MIFGAVTGLIVTVAVTLMWPRDKMRWLRPLAAPVIGILIAYALMRAI